MGCTISKNNQINKIPNKFKHLLTETNFNENDIVKLLSRFLKVTNNKLYITQEEFTLFQNILGIQIKNYLLERLYKIIDNNKNENFSDFIKYLDVLINGNNIKKAEFLFKIIDYDKKMYITRDNLSNLFILIGKNELQFDYYTHKKEIIVVSNTIFDIMDINKLEKVYLNDFKASIEKNTFMLQIFGQLGSGIHNLIKFCDNKYLNIINNISSLSKELNIVIDYIKDDKANKLNNKFVIKDNLLTILNMVKTKSKNKSNDNKNAIKKTTSIKNINNLNSIDNSINNSINNSIYNNSIKHKNNNIIKIKKNKKQNYIIKDIKYDKVIINDNDINIFKKSYNSLSDNVIEEAESSCYLLKIESNKIYNLNNYNLKEIKNNNIKYLKVKSKLVNIDNKFNELLSDLNKEINTKDKFLLINKSKYK